ncbi:hypothetical protein CspeluHIS016_0210920 [Cutaneotrichosporon spelunceum]|uniref:Uncharacterized protein n=1 Tax=Cutaneotrichosporon spelunceum TaxID=1672016 RepID=A0AAD3TSC0_9TREE|nr:hypothetical protein CspeluHIS016_0210920 [Cutaneotrichosporon spelunceum]
MFPQNIFSRGEAHAPHAPERDSPTIADDMADTPTISAPAPAPAAAALARGAEARPETPDYRKTQVVNLSGMSSW